MTHPSSAADMAIWHRQLETQMALVWKVAPRVPWRTLTTAQPQTHNYKHITTNNHKHNNKHSHKHTTTNTRCFADMKATSHQQRSMSLSLAKLNNNPSLRIQEEQTKKLISKENHRTITRKTHVTHPPTTHAVVILTH